MTTGIDEAAQVGGVISKAKPTYGYYRQRNGWITVSPMTELDELKYRREGWEPLRQYGLVEMASEYVADHPLEALFMRGGAHELCTDQIIQSGLHLNPPLVPSCRTPLDQFHKRHTGVCWQGAKEVVFPQMKELVEQSSFQCQFCERPPFPTEKARSQHEGVMHKDEKSDTRQGETLAAAMVKGLRGAPETSPATASPKHPYACGLCPESYEKPGQLIKHIKDEHTAGEEPQEDTDGEEAHDQEA